MQSTNDIKLGRFLSLVLRHDPSAAGISLDKYGWAGFSAWCCAMIQVRRESLWTSTAGPVWRNC